MHHSTAPSNSSATERDSVVNPDETGKLQEAAPSDRDQVLQATEEGHELESRSTSRGNENEQTDLENGSEKVSSGPSDPNIVDWDGPDDPHNPLNFKPWLKTLNVGLVSAICFVTPLASSMFAPGVPFLMEEFHSRSVELGSFVVSVYVLGFAVGPLVLAPMSEIYGRLYIYHVCNFGFILSTIACALSTNLNMLIGFRFLAGVFGSAPLTNGGGSIADLIAQEGRGRAMSAMAMGPIMGPIIGPVAGGYLAQAKGWRWVFWVLTMISGVFTVLSLIFMRESYAPKILQDKTNRLRRETGNMELRSKLDSGLSAKDFFVRSIIRPAKMLIFSPIVLATSLYVGVVYGYLYILFSTFSLVFEEIYGFSSGSVGLTFLGLGVGSLSGLVIFAWYSDRTLKRRSKEDNEVAAAAGQASAGIKPEYRLPPMIPGAALIPIGLFLYGWTAKYHVHWIVPIIGTGLIGIGNMAVFMCISTYLIDVYTIYAASALAANTVIRSVMGAVLPLAGQKMYLTLGLGWGNSLLAFVAVALLPVPWILVKWGEVIRMRFPVKNL